MSVLLNIINQIDPGFDAQGLNFQGLQKGVDGQDFSKILNSRLNHYGQEGSETLASMLKEQTEELIGPESAHPNFMKGWSAAKEVRDALAVSKNVMPDPLKKRIGLGLMALGNEGAGPNSMQVGASLMGATSPANAVTDILKSINAEIGLFQLKPEALPTLKKIMADSGYNQEKIDEALAGLTGGPVDLKQVLMTINKAAPNADEIFEDQEPTPLTATEDALPAMGQFFMSLGLSPEVAKAVTSEFKPGEPITEAALRDLLGGEINAPLAPCLDQDGLDNLKSFLTAMGASESDLRDLSAILRDSKGAISLDDFVKFVGEIEKPGSQNALSEAQISDIKNLLDNVERKNLLAKTPLFDHTMLMLNAMGDKELDDNFQNLSPALQALRGGISGQNAASYNSGGGHQGGRGSGNSEEEKHYRQVLSGLNNNNAAGEAAGGSRAEFVSQMQGYGGQETLARQISDKMVYSARKSVHRLKMALNPESLGQLDIELKISGDKLTAHIKAENREAYEALTAEFDSLKESLKESGLNLSNMTLSYDDAESGRQEYADLGLKQSKNAHRTAQKEAAAEAQEHIRRPAENSAGLVDRLV